MTELSSLRTAGSAQPQPPLSRLTLIVFAITCGVSVANIYYAQPLLDAIARDFSITPATIGLVITLTQAGYAVGLLVLVPLGDLLDRRRLVIGQNLLSSAGLLAIALAPTATVLFAGLIIVGVLAVVIQVLVAFTAALARPDQRGSAVGLVTSGVVIGVLAARTVSGVIADLAGWRAVYMFSAAVVLVLAAILTRSMPADVKARPHESYLQIVASIPKLFVDEPLIRHRAILAMFIFASMSTLWTSLVLPLSAPPLQLSHTQIGLFGLAALAGALAASGAGKLADRGHAQAITGLALALLTVSWLPIALLHRSLILLAIGVIVLDLAVQAVHVTNQTLIFALRPEARSRIVGGYMVFYSIGVGIGAIASTSLYAVGGWNAVAILGAGFGGAGFLYWLATSRAR